MKNETKNFLYKIVIPVLELFLLPFFISFMKLLNHFNYVLYIRFSLLLNSEGQYIAVVGINDEVVS